MRTFFEGSSYREGEKYHNEKEKCNYPLLILLIVSWLIATLAACASTPTREDASKMDDRIELSAKKSYVFKTYLKADDIKIQSIDGVVTLTGTVSEESHKSLAKETVRACPESKAWTTGWKSKVNALLRTRMHGSQRK